MATYDSLHISGGMGVQDEDLKAGRRDGLSVCIGLGGTGKDAIKQLKKAVYKNLKPDDLNSPIPTYRNIKFLVVDMDSLDPDLCRNVYGIDPASEFFSISSSDIAATFRSHDIMKARKELSWLNHENISVPDYIYGAGGIRQIGRFCLIDKAGQFKEKLTSLIQDGAGDPPDTINVHIFSGLSGGTGGGIFVDVCYIVRHVLEELGRENALINGCFFLPDVNLSVPAIWFSPFLSKFIKSNGYAALKELDYLMDLERNRDRFVQNYGSFEIDTNRMLVDCCNLISCTGQNGAIMENGHGYDYALHTAVDYVISVLAKSDFSPNFVEAGVPSPDRKHGAVYKYNFLGITHAEVPLTDIATYLGSKLFSQFHDLLNPVPTEKDLEDFVSANNIAFDQLLKQLTKGITYSIPYPASINKANDIIPGDKRVINCADTWIANAMGTLEENCRSMGEGLKQYDIPHHPSSLIARIFSSLIGVALDPSKGPVFAARLLGGQNNKNLLHIIDYYFGNNQERISAELRQEPLRKEELTAAEKNLAKASFISKRRRICEYLEALNRWYIHLAIIDRHNAMGALLRVVKEQVHKLHNEFFLPMTIVLETLDNTFRENDQRLSLEALWPPSQGPLSRPIPILGDLQSHLNNVISGLDPASEAQNLVQHLLDNWRSWIIQDENKITRLISRYITQKFASVTHNDMEYWINFLQITLPDVIRELMRKAAEPMLGDHFPLSDSQKSNYLLVPASYIGLGVSAARAANEPYEACSQDMNNRMTVIKVYHNLPLYAWRGLADLEKAYESGGAVPGRHLYEAGAVDWREILPSPYPASFQTDGHTSPRITEHREKLTKELEEAKREGIVHCDSENHMWHIKQSKTADLPSLSEEAHDFLTNGKWDMEKLCDLLEHIREVREHMYADGNAEEITLTAQDAENGQEETVLSDDYLRSPAIQRIVREELEKLHGLDKNIAELEHTRCYTACAPAPHRGIEDFFYAVFTGVIQQAGSHKIFFSYEEFDMEQTLDLQTPSMPYGTKAPLYQAYLTYRELDSDMLDRIAEKTNDAIDNMTDEIYAVAKEVQARYSSDFLKMTVSRVAADPKKEEIQNFYKEFVMALQEYIITYM